ncbi:family 20 glycosylhydrolase [Dysgonomonas sp. Marseille-P4677]|uniref:family 20 glycosylhydrolase n=1 Tax=Dysgonomonas sp. Marseille-P4677 TaxID=2364790 RepID=UPI001913E2C7|nr:family 20 glycosylhydrolase [Dysgonomonas sp. Marseille-P4677]MBK5721996.1 family 20 glycosylhydrolase [Dysgonomonas sp. Marseille-P4677]
MKKIIPLFSLALTLLISCGGNEPKVEKVYNQGINITPLPLELTKKEGVFNLSKSTVFVANDNEVEKVSAYFSTKINKSTGYTLKSVKEKPASDYINLSIDKDLSINDEGYLLDVTDKGIDIQANTAQGLFYGMQTVMQLLPAEIESPTIVNNIAWNIPAVTIKDEPRFKYRGMHLDVCRHFSDVDAIKKQLDVLAMFKINRFHWHLTDDQGWRIEIKKYPKLTEMGAVRTEGEGNTYGPFFYTQDQVKEIVAYAKERFIEVIPEIELPGHAVAALNGYPELSCTGQPIEVRNVWGVATDVFCAGNDSVFEFLENVISEVIPLFESEYFHIGGDECPKLRWKDCPKCQARIKELGLKTDKEHTAEERLQSYFVQRIEKFLVKNNKKMIGWDEILEGGLAPSATVMSWRGEEGGIASANMGHDVIMTPAPWMYLDKYQGDLKLLPVTIGGLLTLEKVYNYEPIPEKIAEDKEHHILGAQVNIWCEYKYTDMDKEYDIYPRLIALSELTWSPKAKKDYKDFERRIDNQRVRLDMHNINYYIPIPEDKGPYTISYWGDSISAPFSCNFIAFTDQKTLEFKTSEPAKIVYTTDGSEPTLNSEVYTSPLTFTENTTLKLRSVLVSEKMSPVRTIILEKQTYAPAIEKAKDAKPGLHVEHYKGYTKTVAELENKTVTETEQVATPQEAKHRMMGYMELYPDDFYSSILTGYINIPKDGVYYFNTDCELWIDGNLFISNEKDNNGTARRFSRSDKSIALAKGPHSIKIIRLGAIFGGWPTQWDSINLSIREDSEAEFKLTDASYFK